MTSRKNESNGDIGSTRRGSLGEEEILGVLSIPASKEEHGNIQNAKNTLEAVYLRRRGECEQMPGWF